MVSRLWVSASMSPKKWMRKPTLNLIETHPQLLTDPMAGWFDDLIPVPAGWVQLILFAF